MDIKKLLGNYFPLFSGDSTDKYTMMWKDLRHSFVSSSSPFKVKLFLGIAAFLISLLIALLRNQMPLWI